MRMNVHIAMNVYMLYLGGEEPVRRQQRAINLGRQPPSTRGTDEAAKPLAHWDAEAGVFETDKRATDLFELLDDELHTYGSSAHR